MKHGCFAMLMLACTLAGCRANSAQELLERELRLQEDRIYELEGQLGQYESGRNCREVVSGERFVPDGLQERIISEGPAIERPADTDDPPARTPSRPPAVELPPGLDAPALQPPKVEPPRGSSGKSSSKGSGAKHPWGDDDFEIPLEPPRVQARSTSQAGKGKTDGPPRVTALTLNRMLTGGRSGNAGLTVVVEPRDQAGRLKAEAGDISVVVLNPLESGPAARIARWDFDAGDVAKLIDPSGRGLVLDLDWPADAPQARAVNLYVRYVTADGRELRAEQRVELDVHVAPRTAWSKATRPAPPPEEPAKYDVRTVGHEVEFAPPEKDRAKQPPAKGPKWSPER